VETFESHQSKQCRCFFSFFFLFFWFGSEGLATTAFSHYDWALEDVLFNHRGSDWMIRVFMGRKSFLCQFGSSVLGRVQLLVQRSDKLHAALLGDKLDHLRVDWLVVGTQAKSLPAKTDLGVADGRQIVDLVHLGQQGVRQRVKLKQLFQKVD